MTEGEKLRHYFRELDLSASSSIPDIRRSYRDLAQIWHPDRFQHNDRLREKAENRFKKITEAYEWLIDHLADAQGKSSQDSAPHSGESSDRQENEQRKKRRATEGRDPDLGESFNRTYERRRQYKASTHNESPRGESFNRMYDRPNRRRHTKKAHSGDWTLYRLLGLIGLIAAAYLLIRAFYG